MSAIKIQEGKVEETKQQSDRELEQLNVNVNPLPN